MTPGGTLLGIDIGTSGLKASAFDESGDLLAQAYRPSRNLPLAPGLMEQQPQQWWSDLCSLLDELLTSTAMTPRSVSAVGICGFHHCPVFLRDDGRAARDVILLQDARLGDSRKDLERTGALREIEGITRSMVSAGHFPPIFHYLAVHEPRRLADVRWILLAKDYLRFRLTGEIATEICDATGTNLVEPGQSTWSPRLCDLLGVGIDTLPPIGSPTAVAGWVTDAAAEKTHLPAGTPVVYGGGDSHCALLGLGCADEGDTGLLLGTNSTLRTVFSQFVSHPQTKMWVQHHVVPDRYSVSASSMAGASVVDWFRRQVCSESQSDAFERLEDLAADVPIGSEGLTFLPYIYGERCPFYDPDASGAFVGIRHVHGPEHLLRGVLEGVAVNIANCLDLIHECGALRNTRVARLKLAGGGSGIGLWRQMISDCLNLPIDVMNTAQAGTLGAAMLAGIGAGLYTDHDSAVAAAVRVQQTIEPDPNNAAKYQALRQRFNDLRQRISPCPTN